MSGDGKARGDTTQMTDNELAMAVADEVMRRVEGRLAAVGAVGAEPEYLTLAEAARRTAFSYSFIYDAVHRGDLPATQKGREWRVARLDLRAWMNKDRAGAVTPSGREQKAKVSRLMPGLAA